MHVLASCAAHKAQLKACTPVSHILALPTKFMHQNTASCAGRWLALALRFFELLNYSPIDARCNSMLTGKTRLCLPLIGLQD